MDFRYLCNRAFSFFPKFEMAKDAFGKMVIGLLQIALGNCDVDSRVNLENFKLSYTTERAKI